ncbi:MAG: PAS domain-containing protein [Myxococcales bacterium]|nr:PAS domain-containing protein [Myxococcales bacterium]
MSVGEKRWGLRAQLMLVLALAAVAPTVLLGGLSIHRARRDVQREVIRGNLALIRAIGQQLNTTLQDTRRALVVAAAAWAARGKPTPRVLRRLQAEVSLLRSVAVLDARGKPIGGDALPAGVTFGLDLAGSYGGYVSEVLFERGGGGAVRRQVLLVVQARDRRGELVGFLAAVVDLAFVTRRLADARLGPGASLLVVDGNGRRVASAGKLPAMRAAAGMPLRDHHPGVDAVLAAHSEGHLELTDAAGERWVAIYRNIAGMSAFRGVRWAVLLQQPTSQAYALARKTTRDTLIVAGVVLALALGAGAFFARRMTLPLAGLVRRTERVAAGSLDDDLSRVPEGPAPRELSVLAQSFAQMVDKLRDSRDRLYRLTEFRRNLVESIPVGVMSIDRDGAIRSINPAQQRLSRVDGEAVMGRSIRDAFPTREGDEPVLDALPDVLGAGQTVDVTVDGRTTPFNPEPCPRYHVRISPLYDVAGNVDGAVILQEDLGERVRLEQQLIRSEKLSSIGMLAAGVAHEINNPLTTILGYAKLLLETRGAAAVDSDSDGGEEDPDTSALTLIADEARRVQNIVRELLDFSRVHAVSSEPISVGEVIERTLTLAAPNLKKRGVTVERAIPDDLSPALGDAPRLEQVFVNLITNAAHAMDGGGTLRISAERDGDRVVCAFADSGAGISADDLPRIFDPFFTTKGPGEGTGLGLAVSHRIISDMGGEIEVESTLGEGTTFRVSLPPADATA